MGSDVVKAGGRPPMPNIGKITGLGPGLSKIRKDLEQVRQAHDGLSEDLTVYGMAVDAVRDHVRSMHEDLNFEVTAGGNGGGEVSQEQLEKRVGELVGGGAAEKPQEPTAPLTSDPAAVPGSEH